MIIYSITYFINCLSSFTAKKESRVIKVIVLLLLIFISGTRYYMGGSDVYVYEGVYNQVPSPITVLTYMFTGVNNGVNPNYETGFLLLCSVIKSLHFSYFGFILIWTILFYTLMYKGLKNFVPDWAIFIALFMYKIMFYDTFISIRQGLTIALFCYMIQFIRDRKWYIYFPLCLVAFEEHNSALILFPLYFINLLPISKKFIKIYALIFLPTWFISSKVDISSWLYSIAEFIGNTHSVEHWAESVEKISIIHTLECYAVVVLILLFYDKIMSNERQKEVRLVLRLFMVTIPIFTLFRDWIIFTREKDYFVIMYGVIFGYILDSGTTTPRYLLSGNKSFKYSDDVGRNNCFIMKIAIMLVCFLGMARYVAVFDGGELWHFKSFLIEGASIFRGIGG